MASFGMASFGGAQPQASASVAIDSSTPWVAAADGNLALLQQALQTLNLPLTAADQNGYTLLQAAASYSHLPILEWLVANCPDKSALMADVDNDGDTALHYASTKEAAQFLLHHGADPNLRNSEGKTPLETKLAELMETMQEKQEDGEADDEEDEELINLKGVIRFLQNPAQ